MMGSGWSMAPDHNGAVRVSRMERGSSQMNCEVGSMVSWQLTQGRQELMMLGIFWKQSHDWVEGQI